MSEHGGNAAQSKCSSGVMLALTRRGLGPQDQTATETFAIISSRPELPQGLNFGQGHGWMQGMVSLRDTVSKKQEMRKHAAPTVGNSLVEGWI